MGFDLTGYEKDNSIQMKSFALYTLAGVAALIMVIVSVSFYLFMRGEALKKEMYLQGGIEETLIYKEHQDQFLKSHKLKRGRDKALDYYND